MVERGTRRTMGVIADGAWRGAPLILLGGGPSVMRGHRLAPWAIAGQRGWRRGIVSGAGEALRADGNLEDFWLSIDRPFWQPGYGYAGLPSGGQRARCPRIWVRPPGEPSMPAGLVDLELARAGEDYSEGISAGIEAGIYVAGNSGYAALNLAWHLGADPVYLLGFDCQPGEWHRPGIEGTSRTVCDRWLASMLRLAARFAEVGRRVYWIRSGAAAPEELA